MVFVFTPKSKAKTSDVITKINNNTIMYRIGVFVCHAVLSFSLSPVFRSIINITVSSYKHEK